ncbi:MAG: hypothetical protein ABFD75_12440 [Smithella sp.]
MLTSKRHIINRKVIILQADMTQMKVARKIGFTFMGFYKVMHGINKNPKTHQRICDALGVTKEEFWPEFYGVSETGESEACKGEVVQENAPQCF